MWINLNKYNNENVKYKLMKIKFYKDNFHFFYLYTYHLYKNGNYVDSMLNKKKKRIPTYLQMKILWNISIVIYDKCLKFLSIIRIVEYLRGQWRCTMKLSSNIESRNYRSTFSYVYISITQVFYLFYCLLNSNV